MVRPESGVSHFFLFKFYWLEVTYNSAFLQGRLGNVVHLRAQEGDGMGLDKPSALLFSGFGRFILSSRGHVIFAVGWTWIWILVERPWAKNQSLLASVCLAGKWGQLVGSPWELNGCKMSMSQYTFTLILNTTGTKRMGKEEKTDWVPVSYFDQPCVPELPSGAQLSPESRLHQMPRVVACSSVSY